MTSTTDTPLHDVFRKAAADASSSLSRWLGRATRITVREVTAIPLDDAAVMLGSGDAILCLCAMHIRGAIPGILALATSDECGLALADLLLGRRAGTAVAWGELERSAAAETTNIIGCAYLNAMAEDVEAGAAGGALIPSPPWFVRDYPEAVMGSILMTQHSADDGIFLTRTTFAIEGDAIHCSLVFVPQAASVTVDPVPRAGTT